MSETDRIHCPIRFSNRGFTHEAYLMVCPRLIPMVQGIGLFLGLATNGNLDFASGAAFPKLVPPLVFIILGAFCFSRARGNSKGNG